MLRASLEYQSGIHFAHSTVLKKVVWIIVASVNLFPIFMSSAKMWQESYSSPKRVLIMMRNKSGPITNSCGKGHGLVGHCGVHLERSEGQVVGASKGCELEYSVIQSLSEI